ADVLLLVVQPMNPAGAAAVDPAAENRHGLGAGAGAGDEAADGVEGGDGAAGLLEGLAPGHILGDLALLDDPGDHLDEPGLQPGGIGARPELLNEDHRVALGIVEQYSRGMAALEDLSGHLLGPAAVELAVPQ